MHIVKALWRAFVLLWSVVCAIFLFGVVRTYFANAMGFPFLGTALTLGIWAGGLALVWGAGMLAGRYRRKQP